MAANSKNPTVTIFIIVTLLLQIIDLDRKAIYFRRVELLEVAAIM